MRAIVAIGDRGFRFRGSLSTHSTGRDLAVAIAIAIKSKTMMIDLKDLKTMETQVDPYRAPEHKDQAS